jgi:hypothetical protein
MSNPIKITLGIMLYTLITHGQSNGLVFDNPPTEVCDGKDVTFKIKENKNHPCSDFSQIEWFIRSKPNVSWGGRRNVGKQFFYIPNFGTSERTFQVKAEITCKVQIGVDDDENPIMENRTFPSPILTVKLVHPNFFQLALVQPPSCDASTYEFKLRDPSGTLTNSNLDNISWTVPSNWSIITGATNSTMTVNTNGNNLGVKKVKVKYEAIATKFIPFSPNPIPDPSKCKESKEIEAELDISSCIPEINYPPQVAAHASSHSGLNTNFGAITLIPQHYNFASGDAHNISTGFDFIANSNSSLHLFIEECSCDSEWHDPNLLGNASVFINNPYISTSFKKDKSNFSNSENNQVELIKEDIYFFPNPFDSQLTISNLAPNQDIQIDIITLDQKKFMEQAKRTSGDGSIGLHLEHLSPGVYLIRVITKERNLMSKIIKN